jgi:hypothetical protein
MQISALFDFSNIQQNHFQNKKEIDTKPTQNKASAYQEASRVLNQGGRQDIISISKEATLGLEQIDTMANKYGEVLLGRNVSIGEHVEADEVAQNYENKSKAFKDKLVTMFRQFNISSQENISFKLGQNNSIEIEGSSYAKNQVQKMLKTNPEIQETISDLSTLNSFIRLSDLSKEYHSAYRRNPSADTYISYAKQFQSIDNEEFITEYKDGEVKGYSLQ